MSKSKIERIYKESPDLLKESVERLKELFPGIVSEGKIDLSRLRDIIGDEVDERPERYSFTWAGKRDAIRMLQAPSRATLVPTPEESVNFDQTNNIFVEGENLEVLKLLYKSYAGRVKMIYIDPPYNTGQDFIYPDNFSDPLDTYLKLTEQKDSEGNLLTSNPETSGRFHSAWLSMMYPRLFVARQLLREDGVIFISINDNEVYNLRLLMNDIFGEENFLTQFVWHSKKGGGGDVANVVVEHEYILAYARSITAGALTKQEVEALPLDQEDEKGPYRKGRELNKWGAGSARQDRPTMFFPIPGPNGEEVYPIRNDGSEGRWRWGKKKILQIVERGDALFEKRANGTFIVYEKIRNTGPRLKTYRSLLLDVGTVADGTSQLKELFDDKCPFDFPKPTSLLLHLLKVGTEEESDIVMDFFSGSCTTAHAVIEANRKNEQCLQYIMVQLPEATVEDSKARQMGFNTIAEVGKERIRRVIKKIKEEDNTTLDLGGQRALLDLGFRVYRLAESNYKTWKGIENRNGKNYSETMEMFTDPLAKGWKPINVIYEVALKEGYSLNIKMDEVKGVKGNRVYQVIDPEKWQSFMICLDNDMKQTSVKALNLKKDDLFICRDAALTDELAANLALQCKLKTI